MIVENAQKVHGNPVALGLKRCPLKIWESSGNQAMSPPDHILLLALLTSFAASSEVEPLTLELSPAWGLFK